MENVIALGKLISLLFCLLLLPFLFFFNSNLITYIQKISGMSSHALEPFFFNYKDLDTSEVEWLLFV